MPSGIARICNDARAAKARFYVLHSVEHCTSIVRTRPGPAARRASAAVARLAGHSARTRQLLEKQGFREVVGGARSAKAPGCRRLGPSARKGAAQCAPAHARRAGRFPGPRAPASLKQLLRLQQRAQGRRFPGPRAPASLKRRLGRARSGGHPRFSGASCPGLIEAARLHGRMQAVDRFSGASCPGLIEATRSCWTATATSASFPGPRAPASLKHAGSACSPAAPAAFSGASCPGLIEAPEPATRWSARGRFSGASCPGLIEASSLSCAMTDMSRSFPGPRAPASLKQHAVHHVEQHFGRFPGPRAPASLKRHVGLQAFDAQQRFPGPRAPASLKPGVVGLPDRRHAAVFRGLVPRPH